VASECSTHGFASTDFFRILLVIPPAIHSFYFFDPNGIRLEVTSDLEGDEEDLQVIRSCSMNETELRAELETIGSDKAWIDEMVAAMTHY